MKIEPLAPRETAAEACEKALRLAILRGEIAAGQRLPPERELSETFGVTRITLRSALARLAASGLLQSRQGSGHVVRDFRLYGGPDLLSGLLDLSADGEGFQTIARDLMKVRRSLARAVLETLAERSEPIFIEGVEGAIDHFAELVASGREVDKLAYARADVGVLAAILDATESLVLRLCLNPIVSVLYELPTLRQAIYVRPEDNVEGWRGFLEWMKSPQQEAIPFFMALLKQNDEQSLSRLPGNQS
jgi:GntR family transcriptional regulator, transcriptional repressor for pyruvate dehydrogenase complex